MDKKEVLKDSFLLSMKYIEMYFNKVPYTIETPINDETEEKVKDLYWNLNEVFIALHEDAVTESEETK